MLRAQRVDRFETFGLRRSIQPESGSPDLEADLARVVRQLYSLHMQVFDGRSLSPDAHQAVAEATEGWDVPEAGLDLLIAFASTQQDPDELTQVLSEKFPDVPIIGCTSTGESLRGEHLRGALVVAGLVTPRMQWSVTLLENLSDASEGDVEQAADALFAGVNLERDDLEPGRSFCFMLVDGLRQKEEWLSATLADALDGIPLVGGSAGDDLKFEQTKVFYGGKAYTDAAVLAVARSDDGDFSLIKHQHYTATERRVVITRCDPASRVVFEIDGYPATDAYARALGVEPAELSSELSSMNPITLSVNGELYVRSVQSFDVEAGTITFYCGVENGMVLHVGGHHNMPDELERDLASVVQGGKKRKFLLACNCILRALEADKLGHNPRIAEIVDGVSEKSIGFDTYGEQFDGLHINQTLVAVAMG